MTKRWARGKTTGAAELSRAGMRWRGRARGGRRFLRTGPTSQRRDEAVRPGVISTVRLKTSGSDEMRCLADLNVLINLNRRFQCPTAQMDGFHRVIRTAGLIWTVDSRSNGSETLGPIHLRRWSGSTGKFGLEPKEQCGLLIFELTADFFADLILQPNKVQKL